MKTIFKVACILTSLLISGQETDEAKNVFRMLPSASYLTINYINCDKLSASRNNDYPVDNPTGRFGRLFNLEDFTFYLGAETLRIKVNRESLKGGADSNRIHDSEHNPALEAFSFRGRQLAVYGAHDPLALIKNGIEKGIVTRHNKTLLSRTIYTYDFRDQYTLTTYFLAIVGGDKIVISDSFKLLEIAMNTIDGAVPSLLEDESMAEVIDISDRLGERWYLSDQRRSFEIQHKTQMKAKSISESDALELHNRIQPQILISTFFVNKPMLYTKLTLFSKDMMEGGGRYAMIRGALISRLESAQSQGKIQLERDGRWLITTSTLPAVDP